MILVSCFSKIQTGFIFLVPAHPGSPIRNLESRKTAIVVVSFINVAYSIIQCILYSVHFVINITTLTSIVHDV